MLAGCSAAMTNSSPLLERGVTAFPPSGGPQSGSAGRARSSSGSSIYVTNLIASAQSWASTVTVYPVGSNGDVAPTAVIAGPQTQLSFVTGIVVDPQGEIYVVVEDKDEIVGFPPGSNGNVAPNVIIGGSKTGMVSPVDLAIDASGNLYVANCAAICGRAPGRPSIEVFASGSSGNVKPIKTIAGNTTELDGSNGMAIDAKRNIYVGDVGSNSILMFNARQHGNATPRRVIVGPRTKINAPWGIAVTSDGVYASSGHQGFLERFPLKAHGNVAPIDLISGSQTEICCSTDGVFAAAGGTIYVAGYGDNTVAQFSPTATGNVAPLTAISGPDTQLSGPSFLFIR